MKEDLPGRRFFKKEGFNLHVWQQGDPQILRQLWFKEYLMAHPEAKEAYSALKAALSDRPRKQYTFAKSAFVQEIDHKALLWKAAQGARFTPMQSVNRAFSEQEIIACLVENLTLQMTFFSQYMPACELMLFPDLIVNRCDVRDDTYNTVLGARFSQETAPQRIQETIDLFGDLPFSWWVGPKDCPENLAELLMAQGLKPKEEDLGMYLLLEDVETPPLPIVVERVRAIDDFCRVFEAADGDSAYLRSLPPILYQEGSPVELYTGYREGKPVATGMLVFYGNAAGIYYVITAKTERQKGFGTAMMQALLQRTRQRGYVLATLTASEMGKGIYQKLGFKKCCLFKEFHR